MQKLDDLLHDQQIQKYYTELRAIYSEHVPGKTTEEVEAIIKTFSGREGLLLAKARKKYLPSDGDTKSDNVILVGNKK